MKVRMIIRMIARMIHGNDGSVWNDRSVRNDILGIIVQLGMIVWK